MRSSTRTFLIMAAIALASPGLATATTVPSGGAKNPCATDEHQVRFVNRCTEDIWLAEVGNSLGYCTADDQCQQDPTGIQFCSIPGCSSDADCPSFTCTTDAECPPGGSCLGNGQCSGLCNTAASTCYCTTQTGCPGGGQCQPGSGDFATCQGGLCTYSTVVPRGRAARRWHLVGKGKKGRHASQICVPETWQGRFWGRTGCSLQDGKLTCITGQCGDGALDCSGKSANGVTLFEPAFDAPSGTGTVDYYDVSLVSGYNVPLEVKPRVAGCVVTGACQSDLNASCPAALQITSGTCTTSADCVTGTCVSGSCVVGCSDPCTICTNDPTNATLNCAANSDYYCCLGSQAQNSCNSGSATCFSNDDCQNLGNGSVNGTCDTTNQLCQAPCTTDSDCPGSSCDASIGQCASVVVACSSTCPAQVSPQPTPTCESGIFPGGDVCVPASDCCGPYNSDWLAAAAVTAGGGAASTGWPNVFKAACPTAYSFQYDDPSSTFTCAPTGSDLVNYKVTFCPGETSVRRHSAPRAPGAGPRRLP